MNNKTAPDIVRFVSTLIDHAPATQQSDALGRFDRHVPALLDRLHALYGHRSDYLAWLEKLSKALGTALAERSAELRALDAARAIEPEWFMKQNALGYCAYVDRFAGTLAGVKEKIPHLQELGVTYLHLLPFLKMREGENDGGFAVAAFDEIEPALGSMDDLRDLTAALRQAGISLCSDFILNHVSDTHPWALAAKAGSVDAQAFFHLFQDRGQPDLFEKTLVQIFPEAAPGNFTFDESLRRWVWTTFYPYQWDLNYSNPEVFLAMVCALLHLANQGVEVFRLDSTAFLWKREGTNGMNQPEVHWILQAMRSIVEIVAPGILLKAEAIVPTAALGPYFGNVNGADAKAGTSRECHLAYHSSLMSSAWVALAQQDAIVLREVVKATPELPHAASWITYVRCHDDVGWTILRPELAQLGQDDRVLMRSAAFLEGTIAGSFSSGVRFQSGGDAAIHGTNGMAASLVGLDTAVLPDERELACRRLFLMYSVAFCFGGTPLIYMGDELGLANEAKEAWQAAGKVTGKKGEGMDSRWVQRPHLPPALFAARHDEESLAGQVFAGFKRLVQARQRLEALASNEPRTLIETSDTALLAIKRGGTFWLAANFSDEPKSVPRWHLGLPAGQIIVDCLNGEHIGKDVPLAAWQARWLVVQQ